MPIGYLIGALVGAAASALALWPRPTNGPRADPAFVFESNAIELPFVISAELPGGQHNFDQFPSIRCAAVADAIEGFTAWVRSAVR